MSALAANNAALIVREGRDRVGEVKASTAVYGGSIVMKGTDGKIVPLATTAGCFEGVLPGGGSVSTTATERKIALKRAGKIKVALTGVAITDIGKAVFATTDNPADLSLTYSAGAKLFGQVCDLVYDSNGAVSNYAWVEFDADRSANTVLKIVEATVTTRVGVVEALAYVVPAGRKAKNLGTSFEYDAKPNYATSSALDAMKISGTTRTSQLSGTVNINNQSSPAVDTVTAGTATATAADLLLAEGDRLVGKVASVGSETTLGNVKFQFLIAESPN